jgi:hypothetical protein
MNIEKWVGLVTAASPYSVPPGGAVEQNNLQVRKPGQLTPRPGMSLVYQGTAGAMLSLYRATDGKSANDRLISCRLTFGDGASTNQYVTLEHLTYSGSSWSNSEIFKTAGTKETRPSICQDRFGHIYAFFGGGITPQTFRHEINGKSIDFGIPAPTVAPSVSPVGDGWFIERVDVLSSGTSYYTPPVITVSDGNPDRNASLRAVVQAGAIVAIDVVDGGSNFRSVPTLTVSNEQIGTGFFAVGTVVVDPAVYGYKESTAPTTYNSGSGATITNGTLTTTHQYGVSQSGSVTIAYRESIGGDVKRALTTFNEVTGRYTALVPLTAVSPATGKDAYAKIEFSAASSAYKVGAAYPSWASFQSPDNRVSTTLSGAAAYYQSKRLNWDTAGTGGPGSYYSNTASPADAGIAGRFTYWGSANRDSFWGLGFSPNTWRFAKSQVRIKGITPDDWLGNNKTIQNWGAYYFPDYASVSYKMLIGPCTAASMANEANWQTYSSPVQFVTVSNVKYPYIDVPLRPTKKDDGSSYSQSSQTIFPTVRVYLAYCPDTWTCDNTAPSDSNDYNKRWPPHSGQDRRNTSGGNFESLHSNNQDAWTRWYAEGFAVGFLTPKPIVDFRGSPLDPAVGVNSLTCQMVNPGAQMEAGTAFAIRFEQYNAYDYQIEEIGKSTSWTASGPAESQKYRNYGGGSRRSSFGSTYTDFYFQANAADTAGSAAAFLTPGTIFGPPTVTVFGSGWTASGQMSQVYFPTRSVSAPASDPASWTSASNNQRGYGFATEVIVPASPQKTIGTLELISGGQNYHREPTILFRGGGGYGLKVQSTQEGGKIKSLAIIDGGDGFSGSTSLYTDVQPAKLMPILRGTMRGKYRCAYRFADYSETAILPANITTARGSKTATLTFTDSANTATYLSQIKPGMQLTWRGNAPFSLFATSLANQTLINVPTLDGISVGTSVTDFPTGTIGAGGRFVASLIQPATTTAAAATTNSTTLTVASNIGIQVGMSVRGTGIPDNTIVQAIATNTLTLTAQATVANATSLTFGPSITISAGNPASAASNLALAHQLRFGESPIDHLVKIVSISGNQVTLATPANQTGTGPVRVRDMTKRITYSDFSPIVDVDADANGSGRASQLVWSLSGVTPPGRAQFVEFFRTSADQSLVFYRLSMYGRVENGSIVIYGSDGISDEELFDPDRPAYASLPVVLPNGGLNAYRFGTARNDMAVAVAWQDRLWYGVSTSGKDQNTVFFSEYDEFESCPDTNELPIQGNLRTTDYLTALIPFGSVLIAMQTAHSYTINFNTDPSVDAVVTLASHRGCLSQSCWDIFDDQIYAADERGVYRVTKNGEVESLSEPVRDWFDEGRIWLGNPNMLHLRIDPKTAILRFFAMTGAAVGYPNVTLCYHITNKAWWTESWPNSLTCSCDYKSPATSTTETIYGAFDGNVYQFSGLTDVAYRDAASVTITNPGSGYTTPPTISTNTASSGGSGSGARFRGVVQDGKLVDVIILRGGWNYGTTNDDGTFNEAFGLTITGGGGAGAAATAYARPPSTGVDATTELPILTRTTVPWNMRTGPMPLVDDNTRGGDAQIDRSVSVTYRPTETSTTLVLREYFNNSANARNNAMPRDRGTGFIHKAPGARTTLDMASAQLPSGFATGLAVARFAGRSLSDMASSDKHIAVELACDAVSANDGDPTPSATLLYAVEVKGVADGGQ